MLEITSKENQYVKQAASLKQKKFRDETGLFLVEGERSCREAIDGKAEVLYAFATSRGLEAMPELGGQYFPCYLVPDRVMNAMADTKTPQGTLLVARQEFASLRDVTEDGGLVVLLDHISDPGNVGAILRTAWAAGAAGVVVLPGSADLYSPKVVRASMGAIYHLELAYAQPGEAYQALQQQGFQLLVADAGGQPLPEVKQKEDVAWVLGNEANGPSDFWRQQAGAMVAIPMAAGVESLNVAVAAGILLFSGLWQK